MRKIFLSVIAVLFAGFAHAQFAADQIQWTYTAKKIAPQQYELHITATLNDKWHIYAQDAGDGPVPTSFVFKPNPLVKLDGKVKEDGKLEKNFDKNFNSELKYYEHKVDFVQKIKLKSSVNTTVKGVVTYMICNDRQCLPPKDVPFSIKVNAK